MIEQTALLVVFVVMVIFIPPQIGTGGSTSIRPEAVNAVAGKYGRTIPSIVRRETVTEFGAGEPKTTSTPRSKPDTSGMISAEGTEPSEASAVNVFLRPIGPDGSLSISPFLVESVLHEPAIIYVS
jgi:hypothetical protein